MILEKVKADGLRNEFKVVFNADEIEGRISDVVLEKAKTFKMHGFRPGHVPLHIVRNAVEGSARRDVLESLISDACSEILKQIGSRDFATRPMYRFENDGEVGSDITVTIVAEAIPSFELLPFSCKMRRVIPKVSDEEVRESSEAFFKVVPLFEKAERGYAVQNGDEVTYIAIRYNNGVESKKISRKSEIIPEEFTEDTGHFKEFLGKKVGDSFYIAPDESQQNIKDKIIIKTVKRRVTSSIVEEREKRDGNVGNFDTIIREQIVREINELAYIYHKNQILESLKDQYDFPLPQSILISEVKQVVAEVKRDILGREEGTGEKQDMPTDSQIAAEYMDVIKQRVTLGYVLNKMAQEVGLEVSNKELYGVLTEEIQRNAAMRDQILNYYKEHPDAIEYRRAEVKEYKVISYLITKAETEDVEMTRQEIRDLVDDLLYESEEVAEGPLAIEGEKVASEQGDEASV
ncbi:MAG: hypothetical protein LBF65_02115 [Holosporales bacterium]|jgi:trigger factor|nr:hypothetical protein [Holosporales bacterium]